MKYLGLIFLLLVGLKCSDALDEVASLEGELPAEAKTLYIPVEAPQGRAELVRSIGEEEFNRANRQIAEALFEMRGTMLSDANPAGIHATVKVLFDQHAGNPLLFKLEQNASNMMLRLLLRQDEGPGRAEMLAFHTKVLLRNRHSDSSVLAPALEALRGYWSDEKIKESATFAAAFCEAKLQRLEAASKNGMEKARLLHGTSEQIASYDDFATAARNGLERLYRLAQ